MSRTQCLLLISTFTTLLQVLPAPALQAMDWTPETHTLAVGDFNGDHRDDLLVIARDPWRKSGLVLADATGQLTRVQQVWRSDHLGIDWAGNRAVPIVGSFSAGKCTAGHMGTSCNYPEDVYLQSRDGGVHSLLFTDHTSVTLDAIQQQFIDPHLSVDWSANRHHALAAHLDRDNYHDLFLQAVSPADENYVVFSTTLSGFDDPGQPAQSWPNRWAGFDWSVADAIVHSGDFTGDGIDDLLVQGRTAPGDPYAPGQFGILAGQVQGGFVPENGAEPSPWLTWARRDFFAPDWSPEHYALHVGNFNNDRYDDVLLQPLAGGDAYIVFFGPAADMATWTVATLVDGQQGLVWSVDAAQLWTGDFNGDGRTQLYRVPVSGGGAGQLVTVASVSAEGRAELSVKSSPVPVLDTDGGSQSPVPGTAVGATPGQFAVNDLGVATYTVPIQVPPGVRGMQPELSLQYDSSLGNGLLGVGWRLAGLPEIERCSAIADPQLDGFTDGVDLDGNDRFCLDGQRLVAVGDGSEYRTEVDSLQRVRAVGQAGSGPGTFLVEDRDGVTWSLGGPSGRVAAGELGDALVYLATRAEDRYGNHVRYEWGQDGDSLAFRPDAISWHDAFGEELGRLEFGYSPRTDTGRGWRVGQRWSHPWRLTELRSYTRGVDGAAANIPVRAYHLDYAYSSINDLSHLVQLTECELTAGSCLGATRFGVQTGERGFLQQPEVTGAGEQNLPGLQALDINNNGIPDYVYLLALSDGKQAWNVRADGLNGPQLPRAALATDWDRHIAFPVGFRGIALDFNGDGHTDLAQATDDRDDAGTRIQLLAGGDDGFDIRDTSLPSEGRGFWASGVGADVNGDGLDDLVSAHGPWVEAFISDGNDLGGRSIRGNVPGSLPDRGATGPTGGVLRPLNFNGDGRTDLLTMVADCEQAPYVGYVCQSHQWVVYAWLDDSVERLDIVFSFPAGDYVRFPRLLDANGDGLTDLLFHHAQNHRWELHVSDGQRFRLAWFGSAVSLPQHSDAEYSSGQLNADARAWAGKPQVAAELNASVLEDARVIDYDRDGRDELLLALPGQANLQVLVGDGEESFVVALIDTGVPAPASSERARLRVVDAGGDGARDLLWPQMGGNYLLYHGRGPHRGLVTSIEDGTGHQTRVRYGLMTDPAVYLGQSVFVQDNNPVTFPYRHYSAPVYVVQESAVGDATAVGDSAVLTHYSYEGAKYHGQGRGLLGFARMIARNENRGVVTENHFAQRFPFRGMLARSLVRLPDDAASAEMKTVHLPGITFSYPAICDEDVTAPACQSFISPGSGAAGSAPEERVISRSESRLSAIVTATGENGISRLPFVQQITDYQYSLSPADEATPRLQKRVTTTYHSPAHPVDQWGNPSRILVEADDGSGGSLHGLTVTNTWQNRTDDWCPGLLKRSVTTRTAPGMPPVTREETFQHDSRCALVQAVTQPGLAAARVTQSFAYDELGNRVEDMVAAASEAPRSSRWNYGARYHGRFVTSESNPAGHSVAIRWDPRFGLRSAQSLPTIGGDSSRAETLFRYDNFGRMISRRGPQPGIREEWLHQWCSSADCDAPSAVTRVLSLRADGQEFVQEFDSLGRTVHAHRLAFGAGRIHVDRRFDALGREYLTSRPYADGQANWCYRFREFDALNRVIFEQAPTGAVDCIGSTPPGPAARPPAAGRQEISIYDLVAADGIAVQRERRFPGEPGTVPTTTELAHDVMDRPVRVTEVGTGATATATYQWFADGNLAEVSGPDGTVTSMTYDSLGHLNVVADPHLGQRIYVRNALGEVTWEIDGNGQLTGYQYDGLSRLTKRIQRYNYLDGNDPEQLVTEWVFDTAPGAGAGRLAKAVGPYRLGSGPDEAGQEVRWHYDAFGQPTREVHRLNDAGQLIYAWWDRAYDEHGRLAELIYPSAALDGDESLAGGQRLSLSYSYDGRGYLKRVRDSDDVVHWESLGADANGAYAEFLLDNGAVNIRRTRDVASGRLVSTSARRGWTWQQQQFYHWSGNGDLQYAEDAVRDTQDRLDYDALGRLAGVVQEAGDRVLHEDTFRYDSAGNIVDAAGAGVSFSYDPSRPQAVRQVQREGAALPQDYVYDENGNVLARGADVFEWTPSNQLAAVRSGGRETRFDYDHAGRVYRQSHLEPGLSRRVLHAGPDFSIIFTNGTAHGVQHRLRAAGELVAIVSAPGTGVNDSAYLYRDALGSIVGVADGGGLQAIGYRSWGEPYDRQATGAGNPDTVPDYLQSDGPGIGFTGHRHLAANGFVHMGGRVLDAVTGRFLSPDPVTQFPLSPHGLNRYAYALNRPATFVDPYGLSVGDWVEDLGKRLFFAAPTFVLGGGIGGALGWGPWETAGLSLSLSVTGYRGQAGRGRAPVTATAGPGYTGTMGLGQPRGIALSLADAESVTRESTATLTHMRVQFGLRGWHHAAGAARTKRDGVGPVPDPAGEAANRIGDLVQPSADKDDTRRPGQVYLVGHPVQAVGPLHTAIEYRDEYGVFWISAGPEGWSVEGFQVLAGGVGTYTNGVRPTDVPANNAVLAEVQPPPGLTSQDYFERLRSGASAYCNCADYDLFPDPADGYNSNSYTIGLIQATGGRTDFNPSSLVGGNKPLPPAYFGY